jgi:hypothetical protein
VEAGFADEAEEACSVQQASSYCTLQADDWLRLLKDSYGARREKRSERTRQGIPVSRNLPPPPGFSPAWRSPRILIDPDHVRKRTWTLTNCLRAAIEQAALLDNGERLSDARWEKLSVWRDDLPGLATIRKQVAEADQTRVCFWRQADRYGAKLRAIRRAEPGLPS